MGFEVKDIRNCIKYTRRLYAMEVRLDKKFCDEFSYLGTPKWEDFSRFNPTSLVHWAIRSDEYAIEIKGALTQNEIWVTFLKEDIKMIAFFEDELREVIKKLKM